MSCNEWLVATIEEAGQKKKEEAAVVQCSTGAQEETITIAQQHHLQQTKPHKENTVVARALGLRTSQSSRKGKKMNK